MDAYQKQAYREALRWQKKVLKRSSKVKRTSKQLQSFMNEKIPEKVHTVITEAIKKMIELALTSSDYIYPIKVDQSWDLPERENNIKDRFKTYKRTAVIEGAGTGAGGLWLGLADFPLLLSIKMKFLFDIGQIYGYDVRQYEERVFLLHVFLLAFSSDNKRKDIMEIVMNWEDHKKQMCEVDWKTLQLEYRDTIDFVKMLQLIPGIGAIVGAWANARLMEQLKETAINVYRIRLLQT